MKKWNVTPDRRLHLYRPLVPVPEPASISEGLVDSTGTGASLEMVLIDAAQRFEAAEFQRGLDLLGHAIFVAAFEGPQGLTQHDVVRLIRRVTGAGYHPDLEGPEAA